MVEIKYRERERERLWKAFRGASHLREVTQRGCGEGFFLTGAGLPPCFQSGAEKSPPPHPHEARLFVLERCFT